MTHVSVVLLRSLAGIAPESVWDRLWRVFKARPPIR